MSKFTVNIVNRTAISTAGVKVRTNMKNASTDCPKLWQEQFGPRMCSFPANPDFPDESYGVSVMIDCDNFDYWALMPIAKDAAVPEGMDSFTIPGGLYAECPVASLAELGEAFTYVYGEWIALQDKYTLNMQGASLELYRSDFIKTGRLVVYCPLLEK